MKPMNKSANAMRDDFYNEWHNSSQEFMQTKTWKNLNWLCLSERIQFWMFLIGLIVISIMAQRAVIRMYDVSNHMNQLRGQVVDVTHDNLDLMKGTRGYKVKIDLK